MSESTELTPFSSVRIEDEAPVEVLSAATVYMESAEFGELSDLGLYIPGEIVRGEYGVTGFLVVDPRPELRWTHYGPDPEGYRSTWPRGISAKEVSEANYIDGEFEGHIEGLGVDIDNPKERSWYVGTDKGAKMIRVFLVPERLQDQLNQLGRHLGPAVVQECFTRDEVAGNIPHEDRMTDYPGRDLILFDDDTINNDSFAARFIRLRNGVANLMGEPRPPKPHQYVSFHGWPWLSEATTEGQQSLYRAIAEFDNLVASLDRRKVISGRGLGQLAVAEGPQGLSEG